MTLFNIVRAVLTASRSVKNETLHHPLSALPHPHMKGLLCYPKMNDNSDSRVLLKILLWVILKVYQVLSFLFFPVYSLSSCQTLLM